MRAIAGSVFAQRGCLPLSRSTVTFFQNKYQAAHSAQRLPMRLFHLMEVYTEEGAQRIHEMNEMRFMYEESPHYEQGYVMSEIIERYRKMVMHVKRPLHFLSDTVFDTLKRTELIQKLYFEIYHLVNMAHEIHRKYKFMPEFVSIDPPADIPSIYQEQSAQKESEKIAKKMGKKHDKLMKKIQEMLDNLKKKNANKKKYNKFWPRDYGWEIDYYW